MEHKKCKTCQKRGKCPEFRSTLPPRRLLRHVLLPEINSTMPGLILAFQDVGGLGVKSYILANGKRETKIGHRLQV